MATKYTMETTPTYEFREYDKRKNHRRKSSKDSDNDGDLDPTDGSGSLTYSAASSINSAAESTDSSFADIKKALDGQDSKELASFLKKEAARQGKDEKSVTESLAYSTDADSNMRHSENDSALHGTDIVSTYTGQSSLQTESTAPLAGERVDQVEAPNSNDIMFSPAEYTDSLKRRKDRKRRERKAAKKIMEKAVTTPRAKNNEVNTTLKDSPTQAPSPVNVMSTALESRQGTPPATRPPKAAAPTIEMPEEEDVWYAKWWMLCFPESQSMTSPKR